MGCGFLSNEQPLHPAARQLLLLVDAGDLDGRLVRRSKGDVLRRLHDDGMAVTDGDVQGVALRLGAIAGAHQSQRLLVALGHTDHHVGDQGAIQAVESAILLLVVRAGDMHLVALNLDGDV